MAQSDCGECGDARAAKHKRSKEGPFAIAVCARAALRGYVQFGCEAGSQRAALYREGIEKA